MVIQGPCYGSFAKVIGLNERRLLDNPLQRTGNSYQMDLPQLAHLFKVERPAMMILCNPHNPTGRSWTFTELYELATLCQQHGVTLVSDEIWADLQLDGHRHTSVLSLPAHLLPNLVVATSASKSFGLSSLRISNFIIPDPALRQRFKQRLDAHGLDVFNALSMEAATAAYQHGEAWLNGLLAYLTENRRWFATQLATRLPDLQLMDADATYLAWIDCHQLELDDDELKQRLIEEARVVPSMGIGFGEGGAGLYSPQPRLSAQLSGAGTRWPGGAGQQYTGLSEASWGCTAPTFISCSAISKLASRQPSMTRSERTEHSCPNVVVQPIKHPARTITAPAPAAGTHRHLRST
ncbi:MalY/PatB family protein [Aeromonas veronii]|uniref:MalY/PatB family protein n=1 Tax=Aeromonas veronii TaxID=654 RepID=UPI00244295B6|nr:aminotransferase class I/II-fold pyridoxal phosphate-dependent enzyme [Aeromonas veronii]